MHGSPPKVIWIRIGNCTMKLLLEWITEASEVMQNFDQEDASVLVIESR
jgi:predicted nuclease of predicted toxin-antitoxin system